MTATNSLLAASTLTSPDVFINGTFYQTIGGIMPGRNGTTESPYQSTSGASATYQFLGSHCSTNSYSGANTAVINFRKNGSTGNGSAVFTNAGTSAFVQDSTHTDSVAAGDLINTAFVGNSGGPDLVLNTVQVAVNNATPSVPYINIANADAIALNAVHWYTLFGGMGIATPETSGNTSVRAPGTLSYLSVQITAISGATVTTLLRKNAANGNQSVAATATGWFSDVTHTDSVAGGDTANVQATSASGTCTVNQTDLNFAGSTSKQDIGAAQFANAQSASTTYYAPFAGQPYPTQNTELPWQQKIPYGLTASNYRVAVTSNTSTTLTGAFRKNTAAGNQSVSVASGVSGVTEDSTHTDTVASGDLIAGQYVTGGTVTGFKLTQVVVSLNDGSNTGSSTETGVGVMTFSGVSFLGSESDHHLVGSLAFSGLAFNGQTRDIGGVAVLSFPGVTFSAHASDIHVSGAGALSFPGIAMAGAVGFSELGVGRLTFAGLAIQAAAFDYPPAGKGLRSFSTFGV